MAGVSGTAAAVVDGPPYAASAEGLFEVRTTAVDDSLTLGNRDISSTR